MLCISGPQTGTTSASPLRATGFRERPHVPPQASGDKAGSHADTDRRRRCSVEIEPLRHLDRGVAELG